MTSKNKKAMNRLLGKSAEPEIHDDVVTDIELVKLLNWYNENVKPDTLKSCLLTYAKSIGYNLNHLDESTCKTYGTVSKLKIRGFILNQKVKRQLDDFCRLHNKEPEKSKPTSQPVKKEVVSNKYTMIDNKFIDSIEHGIDAVITQNDEYQLLYPVTKSDITKCTEHVTNIKKSVEIDFKYDGYDKITYKRLIKFLSELLTVYSKTKKTTSTKTISRNKSTIVKSVKCNIKRQPYTTKITLPIDIVGKRKMYCYDEVKKKLILFVAVGEGFTFTGTTLKNFDSTKSGEKTLSKIEKLSDTMSELNKLFKEQNRKETSPSGRFNDNMTILTYS